MWSLVSRRFVLQEVYTEHVSGAVVRQKSLPWPTVRRAAFNGEYSSFQYKRNLVEIVPQLEMILMSQI